MAKTESKDPETENPESNEQPVDGNGTGPGREAVPETPTLAKPEELSPILASAEEQVQSVLAASHQAAQEILEEAKQEAARYVDESRRARVARRREERRRRKNGERKGEAGSDEARLGVEAELSDPDVVTPPPSETGDRVQSVLQATDQAANEILESAKQEAKRYLEECRQRAEQLGERRVRRIAAMADELSEQVEGIRRQAQELDAAIGRARMAMAEDLEMEGDAYADAFAASAPDPEAVLQRLPPRGSRSRYGPPTEGMRIMVMNMQAAGAERRAIEQQLRKSFGIEDPGPLLEDLLPPKPSSR